MKAKHLFILNYSSSEPEAATAAASLHTKFKAAAESTTMLLSPSGSPLSADSSVNVVVNSGLSGFVHTVGVYVVSEANAALKQRSTQLANDICDYLDSRSDLGISAKDLGKIVMVTCNAADRLKRDARGNVFAPALKKMKSEFPKGPDFLKAYNAKGWDSKVQAKLDEESEEYRKKPDEFFKGNLHLAQFACALDQRGVHPKIAAWDAGLFVNSDGSKSVTQVDGPKNNVHERLLNKVMIQFDRSRSGGSIRHLSLQEWSDKDLGLNT